MELKNAVVIITGGSKGLGKALAFQLKQLGALVAISGRDSEQLKKTSLEIHVKDILADVTKPEQLQALVTEVMNKLGRIDIWINNAGIRIPHGPVEDVDMQRFHDMMEVNLFGMVNGSRAALSAMKPKQQGIIVNILSTSALVGRPNSAAYAASKFAAMGFSKSLREGVAGNGITVINVYPGGMQTNFFDEQKPDDYDQYMDPAFVAEKIVQNLQQGKPEEELLVKRPAAS